MLKCDKRLEAFAQNVLERIAQQKTQQERIDYMQRLLLTAPAYHRLSFVPELTQREVECLYYAAMGATSYETAQQMALKTSTIIAHRKEALRKLGCRNVPHAVFKGICYGFIVPREN